MKRIASLSAALLAVPAMALLTACTASGSVAAAPGAGSTGTAQANPTATSGAPAGGGSNSGGGAGTGGSTTGGGSTGGGSAAGTRCHTADLAIADKGDAGGAAAGHHGEDLVFRNKSGHACTLYGYPGVSFVAGDNGTQINVGFTRTTASSPVTVTLRPGASSYALINIPDYQNYPTGACKPVAVRGYRVFPPNETTSVFVSAPQRACSAQGAGAGDVFPIGSGAHS